MEKVDLIRILIRMFRKNEKVSESNKEYEFIKTLIYQHFREY